MRTPRLSISNAIVSLSLAGLLLGALLGCAKPMPQALVDARAIVDAAGNDADVVRLAPVQLDEAEQAIKRAETLWYEEKDTDEAGNQAYLVIRRVEIARVVTVGAKAMEEGRALARQREAVLLEIRTAEADRALLAAEKRAEEARRDRAAAEQARTEADQARTEAAQARAEAAALAESSEMVITASSTLATMLARWDIFFAPPMVSESRRYATRPCSPCTSRAGEPAS